MIVGVGVVNQNLYTDKAPRNVELIIIIDKTNCQSQQKKRRIF